MDLSYTAEQEALRNEIRSWLEQNVPADGPSDPDAVQLREFDLRWQRRQFDGGWAGIAWPVEYGGRGLGIEEQLIWHEEYARARAPYIRSCFVGVNHAGPTLMMRGTESQRQQHLSRILRGEELWCQGFSEPEAGSDLAGIRTRGVVRGDQLVVNGQKIWTSHAGVADFQELLVKTNPEAPRHQGITWAICDMKLPGVTVRPIETMDGASDLCEVFYDDVEIPLENIVGEIGQGWDVAMTTLSFERGTAFMADQIVLAEMVDRLIELARGHSGAGGPADGVMARLAATRAEVAALRAMTYLGVSRAARTGRQGPEGSFLRLSIGELVQRVSQIALEIIGIDSIIWTPPDRHSGNWSNDYLYSMSRTITAGTKDIQRNIIGERLLALPR